MTVPTVAPRRLRVGEFGGEGDDLLGHAGGYSDEGGGGDEGLGVGGQREGECG